ncbi:MAG: VCBS repeat-containing protein [Candidatus Bipolaricaulota bacterium]
MAGSAKKQRLSGFLLGIVVAAVWAVGWSVDRGDSSCSPPCSAPVAPSGPWHTYTNSDSGFAIEYPPDFAPTALGDGCTTANSSVITFVPTFDPSIGADGVRTNLGEVSVTVAVARSKDSSPARNPHHLTQASGSNPSETRIVGGRAFAVTRCCDAGAGNVYEKITYRATWSEVPYEISLLFHYGNLSFYSFGTVTAFDPEPFVKTLDAMAGTFRTFPAHAGSALPPECASWPPYACEETRGYGEYVVRVWKSLDNEAPTYYRAVTVDRGGIRLLCRDWVTGLDPLSGTDINGTGYPDLIIETYSGGAHCCFAVAVYDLSSTLVSIDVPASPGGNAPGGFVDLNGDGVFEFETRDDSFAYTYCCFADSPATLAILEYSPAEGKYVPASYRYPNLYQDEIARHTERARARVSEEADGGWDGTDKCDVLPLVLDYLYSGDPTSAWEALETYYTESDRDAFRAEIESVVNRSPYYSSPSAGPD